MAFHAPLIIDIAGHALIDGLTEAQLKGQWQPQEISEARRLALLPAGAARLHAGARSAALRLAVVLRVGPVVRPLYCMIKESAVVELASKVRVETPADFNNRLGKQSCRNCLQ
ncbi:MAG: hypothetical protein JZU64_11550 [Rhodoferax sp.]|nr:hypothetical protein [Rhodoferax sp.]